MKLRENTEIKITDEPNHVQFVIVHERGWLNDVLYLIMVAVFTAESWFLHRNVKDTLYISSIFLLIIAIRVMMKNSDITTASLFVSRSELIGRSNLDTGPTKEIRVKTTDIRSLGYKVGTEDSLPGLCAIQRSQKQVCLLSGLKRKPANELVEAIYLRFPNIQR